MQVQVNNSCLTRSKRSHHGSRLPRLQLKRSSVRLAQRSIESKYVEKQQPHRESAISMGPLPARQTAHPSNPLSHPGLRRTSPPPWIQLPQKYPHCADEYSTSG